MNTKKIGFIWLIFICGALLVSSLTGCITIENSPPDWETERMQEPPPEGHPEDPQSDPDWRPEEPMPEDPMPFEPPPNEPPPPEPAPPQPQPQQPPAQINPPTQAPQAAPNKCQPDFQTDIAVTDLYAGNLPNGQVHVRITNHGPCTLDNVKDSIYCFITETNQGNNKVSNGSSTVSVVYNMAPGITQTFPTGITIDTNTFKYEVTCNLQPGGWTELNHNNNSHTEKIP